MSPVQRAEVGHRPVKTGQLSQARSERGRRAKCHAKQDFDLKEGLDGSIPLRLLAATLPGWQIFPHRRAIKTDGQRSLLPQRLIVVVPDSRLVDRLRGYAHARRLTLWI